MELKNSRFARISVKLLLIALVIFLIGGIGGVFFQQYVLPTFRTNKLLSRFEFLQRTAENVTVINKTEQITVKEDDLINEVSSQATNAVVNVVSVPGSTKDKLQYKEGKTGTGVLVTSDGVIATYRSAIIEDSATYKAFLFNGNYYDAKLLGVDEFTNLAYLKIDANNLTAISIANSNDFYPGRKLIAISNTFGEYQNRFSSGLLSSKNKNFNLAGKALGSSEKLEGVIEADFSNEAQYLGGPVIGYNGELVGIVGSLIMDNSERFFVVPSNAIKGSVDLAIKGELNQRPYLGMYYTTVTKEFSIIHNLERDRGAMVYLPSGKQGLAVIAGSPAEQAGIRINDIIESIDGQEINLDNPLSNVVASHKKGETMQFKVLRDGKEIELAVKL